MHICPCLRSLGICKNIGIRTYFASVTAESAGFSRHFWVFYKSARTCHFLYCTWELHFFRRIFWAQHKSGHFVRLKVTRFLWNPPIPLLHPNICVGLPTAHPLHCIEFGPPKFFQVLHHILLNFANFRGGPLSKSMQITKKRIETVGNHVQTVGTC